MYQYYFELAKQGTLQSIFMDMPTAEIIRSIDEQKASYRYEPNKWSIKQIIGHITEHERIKMLRAFQLSRKEQVELWGYDQESLVNNSRFDELSLPLLLADFVNVRKASISFVDTLSQSQLQRKGQARQYKISLEEFLRSIVGHEKHHVRIIREKYNL